MTELESALVRVAMMRANLAGLRDPDIQADRQALDTILTALAAEREARERAERERERYEGLIYRPGVLLCAKCNFRLVSNWLNASDGTVSPLKTTEHCPNDGAPMWRVTWAEECREADREWEKQVDRAHAAEAELAALKAEVVEVVRQGGDFANALADADLDETAADGGVTVGMVFQQQARTVYGPRARDLLAKLKGESR